MQTHKKFIHIYIKQIFCVTRSLVSNIYIVQLCFNVSLMTILRHAVYVFYPNAFLQSTLGPEYHIKPIYDPIQSDKFQKTYESRTGCVFGIGRLQEP